MGIRRACALACMLAAATPCAAQSVQLSRTDSDVSRMAAEREAKREFVTGKQAFEDGRFADAVAAFQRVYALSQRSEALFDIGLAADRLRDDDTALDAFERYLRAEPNSPDRARVEQRVAALRAARERRRAQGAAAGGPTNVLAPSPAETAARFHLKEPQASNDERTASGDAHAGDSRGNDPSVFERWWFWTALGAVAAGTITATLVLTQHTTPEPTLQPSTGIVVMTLERAR